MGDNASPFAGAGNVRPGHEIDARRLEVWLAANVNGFKGPLAIQQFKGGQSNPTYKLQTPDANYVMRRKPPGQLLPGAHAVEREYRVINALHAAGFPVPRVYAFCADAAVAGTPFFIMDMVQGRIFWDSSLPEISTAERAACFDAMNATIAQLHKIDLAAAGLSDFGKPGAYFQRQVGRWSKQYLEDDAAGRLSAMDELAAWLPANIPQGDEISLVHGDFRADNMIFHASEPRVLAVLDWELSTLGHPLADFTYHLMMYRLPPHIIGGFNGADLKALNIPSEESYTDAYCARTGRDGIADMNFYMAFNMFRFAAILHGIKGRIARGTAASAHAAGMTANLPELAALAVAQIEG